MSNNSPMFCRLLLLDLRGDDPLGPIPAEEVEPGLRGTGGPAVDDRRTTRLGRRLQRWNVRVLSSITLAENSGSKSSKWKKIKSQT